MSVRIDILYTPNPTGFGVVTSLETIHSDGVANLHGVIAESLPILKLQVEQNLTEFTSGDVSLVCRNDDGWWNPTGTGAFGSASTDPTQRWPFCPYINVYQNNVLVYQGDVDLKTVKFDRKQRTVTFTTTGPLVRLSTYSAESIRRPVPAFADYGYINSVGTISSGMYSGYCWILDTSKAWTDANLVAGPLGLANCCLIDGAGVVWTIVDKYVPLGGLSSPFHGLVVKNPVYAPPNWGKTLPAAQPALGAYSIVPMVFISRYAWNSIMGTVSYSGGTEANVQAGATPSGTIQPYVQDAGPIGVGGTNYPRGWNTTANNGLGQWSGYCLFDSAGNAWLIEQNVSVVDGHGVTFDRFLLSRRFGNQVPTVDPKTGFYAIRRANTQYIKVGSLSHDTGTYSNGIIDSGRTSAPWNWATDELKGMIYLDSLGVPFVILGNSGNEVAIGGAAIPDISGGYQILWSGSLNMLESLGPSISTLGLSGQYLDGSTHDTVPGDTLNLTSLTGPVGSATFPSGFAAFPVQVYSPSVQAAVILFATTPLTDALGIAAGLPVLSDHQLWLTDAITAEIDAGSGVILATPYFRETFLDAGSLAVLFSACTDAVGGGLWNAEFTSPPKIATDFATLPSFLAAYPIPYADFAGKSVMDAFSEFASMACCTLYCTFSGAPTAPLVTYHFRARDVGSVAITDLSAAGVIMERSDGISHEWYYPMVEVEGASGKKVRLGSVRPGANQLSVKTDFADSYLFLNQVLLRLWGFFGARRATSSITVLAELLPNGTIDLLSSVKLDATTGTWWVMGVERPLRQPCDSVKLELVNASGTVFLPSDFETQDVDADPEPPTIVKVTPTTTWSSGHSYNVNDAVYYGSFPTGCVYLCITAPTGSYLTMVPTTNPCWVNLGVGYPPLSGYPYNYVIGMTWAFPYQQLLGFQRTTWGPMNGRQTGGTEFVLPGSGVTVLNAQPLAPFWTMISGIAPGAYYCDFQTVLEDGRMSPPCDAVLV